MKSFELESGYLRYKNKKYYFVLDGFVVKLTADIIDTGGQSMIRIGSPYASEEKVLFGRTLDGYEIAFFLEDISYSFTDYIYFTTNYYIKGEMIGTGLGLDKFSSLECSGKLINMLYDVQYSYYSYVDEKHKEVNKILVDKGIKNRFLLFRQFNDIIREYDINIFNEEAKMRYLIDGKSDGSDVPFRLKSKVILEFKSEILLIKSRDLYFLLKDFFSFLVQSKNIDFDMMLYAKNGERKLKIGDVHMYQSEKEFETFKVMKVINLGWLDKCSVKLIEQLASKEIRTDHLPTSKVERRWLDAKRILAVCTAMEYQYQRLGIKDKNISKITSDVKSIVTKHYENKLIDLRVKQYLEGNIKTWSRPAVDQFMILFDLAKDKLDELIILLKGRNIDVNEQFIQPYVTNRNNFVHSNIKKQVVITHNDVMVHTLFQSIILALDLERIGAEKEQLSRYVSIIYHL